MRCGRLLDEVASESDISDRNIDFLVNRLRTKPGDSAKSPKYIATQYGEGYVWIAASPSAAFTKLQASCRSRIHRGWDLLHIGDMTFAEGLPWGRRPREGVAMQP